MISANANANAVPRPSDPWIRTIAITSTTAPITTSTRRQMRNSRTLTSTCESSGLVRMKSSVPWRTSPISRSMFGWTAAPISPPMRMWTPITASSSAWVQPARSVVWPNTSASTASPVNSEMIDWNTWTARFARYWSSFSAPIRKNVPNSLNGRSGSRRDATGAVGLTGRTTSATHRGEPLDREPPADDHDDRPDHDPEQLRQQPADQLRRRQLADQGLDREAERPLERQEVRQLLGPVGHQRERHEPPGEQQL